MASRNKNIIKEDNLLTTGEKIKFHRIQRDWSQTYLGELVGLKCATISKYELDKIVIPSGNLKDLANVLGLSTDYLLGNTSFLNPKEYLEAQLSKYALTENEYDFILNNFIIERKINLSIFSSDEIRSNVSDAYKEIFNVYLDYLHSHPLDRNIENPDELIGKNEPVDKSFINMLKTLNKYKIIYAESNSLPPIEDIPKKYPVLGKINPEFPIFAEENIEDYSYAPSSKIQKNLDYFFLKIQEDSMNMEFPDGCLLLIQKQSTLEKGEIGVFIINDNKITVKRFKEENGLIMLEPRSTNPEYEAQTYDPSKIKIEIIGKPILFMKDIN